jgi:hypothetical protein
VIRSVATLVVVRSPNICGSVPDEGRTVGCRVNGTDNDTKLNDTSAEGNMEGYVLGETVGSEVSIVGAGDGSIIDSLVYAYTKLPGSHTGSESDDSSRLWSVEIGDSIAGVS